MSKWSGTYNDQQDEVDKIVEGVSVHDEVHDVHPALQSDHLERATDQDKQHGGDNSIQMRPPYGRI